MQRCRCATLADLTLIACLQLPLPSHRRRCARRAAPRTSWSLGGALSLTGAAAWRRWRWRRWSAQHPRRRAGARPHCPTMTTTHLAQAHRLRVTRRWGGCGGGRCCRRVAARPLEPLPRQARWTPGGTTLCAPGRGMAAGGAPGPCPAPCGARSVRDVCTASWRRACAPTPAHCPPPPQLPLTPLSCSPGARRPGPARAAGQHIHHADRALVGAGRAGGARAGVRGADTVHAAAGGGRDGRDGPPPLHPRGADARGGGRLSRRAGEGGEAGGRPRGAGGGSQAPALCGGVDHRVGGLAAHALHRGLSSLCAPELPAPPCGPCLTRAPPAAACGVRDPCSRPQPGRPLLLVGPSPGSAHRVCVAHTVSLPSAFPSLPFFLPTSPPPVCSVDAAPLRSAGAGRHLLLHRGHLLGRPRRPRRPCARV